MTIKTNMLTMPNNGALTDIEHRVLLPQMCPVSGNPQRGSYICISYQSNRLFLEVNSLRAYIHAYIGGKDLIRDQEGTIQAICQDCANTVKMPVSVKAHINLQRKDRMIISYTAMPTGNDSAQTPLME